MLENDFTRSLLEFLRTSPTPFHAVQNMAARLEQRGMTPLHEGDRWQLEPGRGYYVARNGSSLIAWRQGAAPLAESGLRMVGAHTDSPCLRLKPRPELSAGGYLRFGVEVYGSPLLNPWFDRDLSLAGRVSYRRDDGSLGNANLDFARPIAVIPSLAIHLDRGVNERRRINAQEHLPAMVCRLAGDAASPWHDVLLRELREQHADAEAVLAFELSLYDVQPPALVGLDEEFIASARLDNLLSCYIGLQALADAPGEAATLLVCNDHEEVGSVSACGADGPFLRSVLQRLAPSPEDFARLVERSTLISADNAHAVHPNYTDRHDANHGPLLNAGPVVKVNAGQRYATASDTAALFCQLCQRLDVPVQHFASRADLACGTTIGPITAAAVGVRTLDIGVPQLAMHSVRELAGRRDGYDLYRVLREYLAGAET